MILTARVLGGAYLSVEFCTARRPSATLKGETRQYADAFAALYRGVALALDGVLPVLANPSPLDAFSLVPNTHDAMKGQVRRSYVW